MPQNKESLDMSTLSQAVLDEFHQIIGRSIQPQLCANELVALMVELEHHEKRRAQRYAKRVWSRIDVQGYVSAHAKECASHAASLLSDNTQWGRVYELTDARGRRSGAMGEIVFSRFTPYSRSSVPSLIPEATIVIRSIRLHPSLQRKGFLAGLQDQLVRLDVDTLVLEAVYNPSLAYRLYQKSLRSDAVVLLSGADTVDFDRNVSPGPTFALRISSS